MLAAAISRVELLIPSYVVSRKDAQNAFIWREWVMADQSDALASHSFFCRVEPLSAGRVKLINPSNVAIIAALAAGCWAPIALSAYLLIG